MVLVGSSLGSHRFLVVLRGLNGSRRFLVVPTGS